MCFLLLRLSAVHSALCGAVFCLDFDPFFFLLLLPCWVFFLYLFIYLTNWNAANELLVGKMAGTIFKKKNLSILYCLFSLLLSTKQTRVKCQPPNISKLGNSFIVFHSSSHFSKQTRVFTYPTHRLTGAPPTHKHTSLGLKSFF